MTVKTTTFGGTDWSDGDVLYGADLNDTFEGTLGVAGRLVRKEVMTEDTTEHSSSSVSQNGTGSIEVYRFTPNSANNILLGVRLEFDTKHTTTNGNLENYIYATLKNNTTNETINLGGPTTWGSSYNDTSGTAICSTTTGYVSQDISFIFSNLNPTTGFSSHTWSLGNAETCALDGATYDIDFRIKVNYPDGQTGSSVGYIDNVTITLYYVDNVLTTTESAKFSQP